MWFKRQRRRMLLWEARVGRWFYRHLPVLRLVPPSYVPPRVEALALRVLVSALLLIVLVESVILILALQPQVPFPAKP